MKLTIIRLENFSDQDRIDLQKIWPEYSPSSLQVDDNHRIYAARFNERLLAAVRVTLSGTEGALDSLRVREVTRRRGVGQYLLEEVLRNNPGVSCWWMADAGVEDRGVMTAFMQALGFTAQQGGWEKRQSSSLISKVMTNEKLPDALRLSGLQCVLQFTDFFGSCRPDKAFTPHPA